MKFDITLAQGARGRRFESCHPDHSLSGYSQAEWRVIWDHEIECSTHSTPTIGLFLLGVRCERSSDLCKKLKRPIGSGSSGTASGTWNRTKTPPINYIRFAFSVGGGRNAFWSTFKVKTDIKTPVGWAQLSNFCWSKVSVLPLTSFNICGCSLTAKPSPSKRNLRVRLPLPAPDTAR